MFLCLLVYCGAHLRFSRAAPRQTCFPDVGPWGTILLHLFSSRARTACLCFPRVMGGDVFDFSEGSCSVSLFCCVGFFRPSPHQFFYQFVLGFHGLVSTGWLGWMSWVFSGHLLHRVLLTLHPKISSRVHLQPYEGRLNRLPRKSGSLSPYMLIAA